MIKVVTGRGSRLSSFASFALRDLNSGSSALNAA